MSRPSSKRPASAPLALAALALTLAGRAAAQDPAGAWTVTGADPQLGAYAGTVAVRPQGTGFEVTRLVTFGRPLPDGRTLALSWKGTLRVVGGALRADVALRRQDWVKSLGALTRGPQDRAPLALGIDLRAAAPLAAGPIPVGARVAGQWTTGQDEAWVKAAGPAPTHPGLERRLEAAPVTCPRSLFFLFFRDYHREPDVAAHAGKPEFQAAVHYQLVDTTGRDYTRQHPTHVLVVQKVPDAIALHEDGVRADAWRHTLAYKAAQHDREMLAVHVEPSTGMLAGVDPSTGARSVHGDSALHQGVWVASQMYRFLVTGDQEAVRAVELGTRAAVLMVDAPGNPAEFARGVTRGPTPSGWAPSPTLPGLSYNPGGNNDMCHGIDSAFTAAERVLPAGHALLAEVGRCAKQLVEHSKVAQRSKHELVLAGIAARLTGDAGVARRYRRTAMWSPLEMLWTALGEGMGYVQEVSGRSGGHLQTTTLARLRLLGLNSPNLIERLWRNVADRGLRVAFGQTRAYYPGNVAAVAAAARAPGARDVVLMALAELPYPRPIAGPQGAAVVDWSIDPDFCLSPYPFLPWKFDWKGNLHRRMSLVTYPQWTLGDTDNYWKQGPGYGFFGQQGGTRWSSQDYLHAYWAARHHGALTASD